MHDKLSNTDQDIVILIPTYNNAGTLARVLTDVLVYTDQIIVVNDGSTDSTAGILKSFPQLTVIDYPVNKGKGYALKTGLRAAWSKGYRYAITIDSDGQHYADEIPRFIKEIRSNPDSLIIGARCLVADNMPSKNTFANKFSNFWYKVETGYTLIDTQSGYRVYPLNLIHDMKFFTSKYEFELEIIVRATWKGVKVYNIPVKVFYPSAEERVSHFRPLRDFTRISILNTVFVIIALLWYYPVKYFSYRKIKAYLVENLIHTKDSNERLTASVMLGLFLGLSPIWGYQMIATASVSHFLKLNKVVALIASNISLPPLIPFILYGAYMLGGYVLDLPLTLDLDTITLHSFADNLRQYLVGSLLMASLSSIVGGAILYLSLILFRKK